MALGEKLFEETGNIANIKVTKVHPIEGATTEVTFMTGFTNSQNLSWMNSLIIVVDLAASIYSDEFCATAYEWNIASG